MADVIGRFVETALRGREQGVQMFERVQRLQALKEQREQLAEDRARQQAEQQFNDVNGILSDPNKRKYLAPEQLTELQARATASASRAGREFVDLDPIKPAIVKDMEELQYGAQYGNVPVLERLNTLLSRWGPQHFWDYYNTLDNSMELMDHAKEQEAPAQVAPRPPLPGQAREFTARQGGETAETSVQVHEGAAPMPAAEPAKPRSREEIVAEKLFGKYYTPKPPTAQKVDELNLGLANLVNDAVLGSKPIEVLQANRQKIVSDYIRENPSLTEFGLNVRIDSMIRDRKTQNLGDLLTAIGEGHLDRNWILDHSRDEKDRIRAAAIANEVGYQGRTDWTSEELIRLNIANAQIVSDKMQDRKIDIRTTAEKTQLEREKFDVETAMGWASLSLKDRQLRIDEAQGNEQLAISTFNAETNRAELNLATEKFAATMNAPVESISNKDYWATRAKLIDSSDDPAPMVALLDEHRFIPSDFRQQIIAELAKKKAQNVPASQAAPAVRAILRSAGIVDDATIKILTNRYMAESYWSKK